MVINCGDEKQLKEIWLSNEYVGFARGSAIYGTMGEDSDIDIAMIVPDDTEFIDLEGAFDNEKCDSRIHPCVQTWVLEPNDEIGAKGAKFDCQFVRESDFIDLIKEHAPFALEAISIEGKPITEYRKYFELDKWKLREAFSKVSNNSWAKAKKKMTVKKDLDMKCGVKSLFHSMRLYDFAWQIAKYGYVKNFSLCQKMWKEIKADWESGFTWDDFKEKYKPMYNNLHSLVVDICPKPEEFYKNNKNGENDGSTGD